jgi:hypothetical protein
MKEEEPLCQFPQLMCYQDALQYSTDVEEIASEK